MFETTSEGVSLISSGTGRFVAVNPAMRGLFEYTEEEFLGMTPEDITPLEAKEIMRGAMKTLFSGGTVPDHEGISLKKDSTKINVIVSCRPIFWKGETVFSVTFKDITYLKEIQHRLEQKNKDILNFTNMVTHDLRNPLTGIKAVFGMLSADASLMANTELKELLELGSGSADYMQNLVNDLLDIARLETGTKAMEKTEMSTKELIEPILLRLRLQAKEANVRIDSTVPNLTIIADARELTKVFSNLMGNAIAYIGKPESPRVTVGILASNGVHTFFVADNGMGIPEESRPVIFEKFKRGKNVHAIKGTGLGLAIVKGIVEAHGGRIWFESETGKGTTFFFTIPAVNENGCGYQCEHKPDSVVINGGNK
jgi:PAS domain S-box-containing protein